jgi:hypothetical protein
VVVQHGQKGELVASEKIKDSTFCFVKEFFSSMLGSSKENGPRKYSLPKIQLTF